MKTPAVPGRRAGLHASRRAACLLGGALLVAGCTRDRVEPPAATTFRDDVGPLSARACVRCHQGETPAAGWRAGDYVAALGCVATTGEAAVLPPDARAPVLRALASESHRGFLSGDERATFLRWVEGGAPDVRAAVHAPGFENPRSPAFHGAALRAAGYAPLIDAGADQACGRCHDGVASRPSGITRAALGATSCLSCHTRPEGVLACSTCHGDGDRAFPPRDPCFFASASPTDAHRVHVEPTGTHAVGFDCATCHPVPGASLPGAATTPLFGGLHADGRVEIAFDPARVSGSPTYDAATGACTVSCHQRGGARPTPAWSDASKGLGPLGCGDCHSSPPAGHYPGACSSCHAEADAHGTALSGGPLHLNGIVDLGDGSGACGACHGNGASPWPKTNAHPAHHAPQLATPFTCTSCHPDRADIHVPGHLDGVVQIAFGDHALDRGAVPTWDGASCASVGCHGANLPDVPLVPRWTDTSGAARECVSCHGAPPIDHTPSSQCGRSDCHGGEADSSGAKPTITDFGRALHVDGVIEFNRSD